MFKKILSILLSVTMVISTLAGVDYIQPMKHVQAEEIPDEVTPYDESDFVDLYENPDGFISGSTLIFNNEVNFRDQIRINLKRMKEVFHVNTVGVYDLVHMSDKDRTFFFEELKANHQKTVIRIENYDARTFTFDPVTDVNYVMNYYTAADPENGYTSLLDYIKNHNYTDEIAYFAINMPVDDGTVANNFQNGRANPEWSSNQLEYASAIIGRMRDFFSSTPVQLYLSVFYGWDLTYPTPSYADIENKADGYFLNNYVYPLNGVIPDESSDPSVMINQAGLQASMDLMMSQYPTQPKIIEYGFHTQEFSDGKHVDQTAGLVKDLNTKKIALKAVTKFYKNGKATTGTAAGMPFNFRGSLYFAQNLYKEEGTPAVLLDWALDYPETEVIEAEDSSSVLYEGGLAADGEGVDLDAEGKGVTFFRFGEDSVLRVKYSADNDTTLSILVNGSFVKKAEFQTGDGDCYIPLNIPLQGSVELKRMAGDGEVFIDNVYGYANYEADINTAISGGEIREDGTASMGKMVAMSDTGDSVTYSSVKNGTSLTIAYSSSTDALLGLYINGKKAKELSFEGTEEGKGSIYERKTEPIYIPTNANVGLKLIDGSMKLDYLQVSGNYEAEYASGKYNGATCVSDTEASEGTAVTGIVKEGASIVWNGLIAGNQLKIRYANDSGTDRQLTLYVNGVSRKVVFSPTTDKSTFEEKFVTVIIPEGANVILQRDGDDTAKGVYIDSVSVLNWYEAEALTQSGTTLVTEDSASSGLLSSLNSTGASVELTTEMAASQFQLRYAAVADTKLGLYINDRHITDISMPATGSETDYLTLTSNADIPAGAALRLVYLPTSTSLKLDTLTLLKNTEAENANFSGGASVYSDMSASGGMGAELKAVGDKAEYTNLRAGNQLAINYTCATDGKLSLYVNDEYVKDISFPSIGVWKGTSNTRYADAEIPSNATVAFRYQDGGSRVRIDNFTVLGISEAENSYKKSEGLIPKDDETASGGLAVGGFSQGKAITFIHDNGADMVTFRYKADRDSQLTLALKFRNKTDDTIDKFAENDSEGYYKTEKLGTLSFPSTAGEYKTVLFHVNMLDFQQLILKAEDGDTVDSSFLLDYASFTDRYATEAAASEGSTVTYANVKAANRILIGYRSPANETCKLYLSEDGDSYVYKQPVTFQKTGDNGQKTAERVVDIDIPYGADVRLEKEDGSSLTLRYIKLTGIYQAENSNFSGHTRTWYSGDESASGKFYAWGFSDIGDGAQTINVRAGNQVIAGYAEGPDDPKGYGQLGLLVNGNQTQDVVFPSTGSWGNWKEVTVNQSVEEGSNLKLQNVDQSGKTVNYDYMEVRDTAREAENGNLYGNAYTYGDTESSYGMGVSGLNAVNDAVEFCGVNGGSSLRIRYGAETDGALSLYVNGIKRKSIIFPSTGGWTGKYAEVNLPIDIPADSNIRLQFDEGSAPITLDQIEITGEYSSDGKYEAENGILGGDARVVADTAASNTLKVDNFATNGSLEISELKQGKAILIRYASTKDASLLFQVNGRPYQTVDFPSSAGVFVTKEIKVNLPEGVKIALRNTGGTDMDIAIDYVQVSDRYEAEYAVMNGVSGDGHTPAAIDDSVASNGKAAANLWAPDNGSGSFEFPQVGDGTQLTVAYSNGDTASRKLSLYVNDVDTGADIAFPPTGGWTSAYQTVTVPVNISAGSTVKLQKDSGDTEVTVDYIYLDGVYEAENASKLGSTFNVDDYLGDTPNASGGIQVSGLNTYSSGLVFTNVTAGNKIDLTYASENGGEIYIYVNDGAQQKVILPATGSYTSYGVQSVYTELATGDSVKILCANPGKPITLDKIKVYTSEEGAPTSKEITAGENGRALIFEYNSSIDGTMSLSVNDVKRLDIPVTDTKGASVAKEIKLDMNAGDVIRLDYEEGMNVASMMSSDKYEAEYANLYGIDGTNPTAIEPDQGASNGYRVVHIWGADSYLEFENVGGGTSLTMGYSAGDAAGRKISLYVNGVDTGINLYAQNTGGFGGNGNYGEVTVPCDIPEGATIKLKKDSDDWSDFFVDYIKVTGEYEPTAGPEPTVTTEPTTSPEPTVTTEPTTSPEPTVTAEPTTSPEPTVTAEPTTSPKPTVTAEPTTGPEPTVTAEPTTGPEPTVTAEPTTSPEPTVTAEPTTSPEPTVTAEPTTSPKPTVTPKPVDNSVPVRGAWTVNGKVKGSVVLAKTDEESIQKAFEQVKADTKGAKTIKVTIKTEKKASSYQLELPCSIFQKYALKKGSTSDKIQLNTALGTVTLPLKMFKNSDIKGKKTITIAIKKTTTGEKDKKLKTSIGNRPEIIVSAIIDKKAVAWKNSKYPIEISIKYQLTAKELKNAKKLYVFYIDSKGKAKLVPGSRYDAKSEEIKFTVTYLGHYAIGYQQ